MPIRIIPRTQWGAPPTTTPTITTPTPELWLHHTAGTQRGPAGMRQIRQAHLNRGWQDIGYSFVIDPHDQAIYEGRGPGRQGAHTEGHNSKSHGICIMGNYEADTVTPQLINTIADLVHHGHQQGWWPPTITGGHRDTKPTACPGQHLYNAIPQINHTATQPEPPMPNQPHTWTLNDLPNTTHTVETMYQAVRLTDTNGITEWKRDLANKLAQHQDPTPTLEWIWLALNGLT